MKKKQPINAVTIADVLHYAADECLAYDNRCRYKEKFSCSAIDTAIYRLTDYLHYDGLYNRIMDGLSSMGCETGSCSLFKKYGDQPTKHYVINETVQGMRYMWLKWAALMAEEQGV